MEKDTRDYLFHYLTFWMMYSLHTHINDYYEEKKKALSEKIRVSLISEMESKAVNSSLLNRFLKEHGVASIYAGF